LRFGGSQGEFDICRSSERILLVWLMLVVSCKRSSWPG
jgi:hypothetical protein